MSCQFSYLSPKYQSQAVQSTGAARLQRTKVTYAINQKINSCQRGWLSRSSRGVNTTTRQQKQVYSVNMEPLPVPAQEKATKRESPMDTYSWNVESTQKDKQSSKQPHTQLANKRMREQPQVYTVNANALGMVSGSEPPMTQSQPNTFLQPHCMDDGYCWSILHMIITYELIHMCACMVERGGRVT
eukprot:m.64043 g.64043  ORF g.64043 m.64043 type:complete len:186 (+) comp11988_c0_seq3:724-1281(+)